MTDCGLLRERLLRQRDELSAESAREAVDVSLMPTPDERDEIRRRLFEPEL